MRNQDLWKLTTVDNEPVWVWDNGLAMIDDVDFEKLLVHEATIPGETYGGKPYLVRPAHWHQRLYVDRDGWTHLYNNIRHVTLFNPQVRGMAWEAVNGNRADVRCKNLALVEHVTNTPFPGVYFDGVAYRAAVNGRRVGKAFECAEDAYRWAHESWLPMSHHERAWALDNIEKFEEQAVTYFGTW